MKILEHFYENPAAGIPRWALELGTKWGALHGYTVRKLAKQINIWIKTRTKHNEMADLNSRERGFINIEWGLEKSRHVK